MEGTEAGDLAQKLRQKFNVTMCPAFVVTLPDGRMVESLNVYFGIDTKSLQRFLKRCQKNEVYSVGLDYLARGI